MYRQAIERALSFSPRKAAERSGAKKPDRLASALAAEHSARLRAMLQETGDSYLGQSIDEFARLAQSLGFDILQQETGWNNGATSFLVLGNPEWLIFLDSYQGMVNQAYLLFRCEHSETEDGFRGAVEVRQGLKHSLQKLQNKGGRAMAINYQEDRCLLPPEISQKSDPRKWTAEQRRHLKAGN